MSPFKTGYMVQEGPYCAKGYVCLTLMRNQRTEITNQTLAGAGKTVITSIVVDHLQRTYSTQSTGDIGIAYVYCKYKEVEQNAASLIASLLQQLVKQQPSVPDDVRSVCEDHMDRNTRPRLAELSRLLQQTANEFSKVFVVVDALDESPEETRRELIVEILKLRQDLHFIATSRHNVDTEHLFRDASLLEIRADDADVESYVHGQINRGGRLGKFVQADPSLRGKIVEGIVSKAQGMFLLAQLHIKSLERKQDRKAVRLALARLPQEIDEIYDDALDRINSQNREDAELAERILMWVVFAKRPLTVKEVQHAVAVMKLEPGETHLDEDGLPEEDLLLTVCAGIVVIGMETSVIQLVHYTTQEYFERVRFDKFPTAQASIAKACLAYLSLDNARISPCSDRYALWCHLQENPLMHYATMYWGTHARGPPERTLLANIMAFFNGVVTECALVILLVNGRTFEPIHVPHDLKYEHECHSPVPKVAYAASLGLREVVSALVDDNCNVNALTVNGASALHLAIKFEHEAVVKLLLERGAGVNNRITNSKGYNFTALIRAAIKGQEAVAKLLLDRGAEVNARDSHGVTALIVAAKHRYKGLAKLLLDRGAEVNHRDSEGNTALMQAAKQGNIAVAKLLLDRGAEVDAEDSDDNDTALVWALSEVHDVAKKWLLHRAAMVNRRNSVGNTALFGAAERGQEAVAELLLDRGAEVNHRNSRGNTALMRAAEQEKIAVAKLLLDRGAEVNAYSQRGWTALIVAAEKGQEAVAELLLDRGAEINQRLLSGATALIIAAQLGQEAVAKLLLDRGAEVNYIDSSGDTALMRAADRGHEAMAKLLLDRGAEVNHQNLEGKAALIAAVAEYYEEPATSMINLLVDRGAEINAYDCLGQTALTYAIQRNFKAVAELLLDRGAKVDARNSEGMTALIAVHDVQDRDRWVRKDTMSTTSVKLLLERGADVNARDSYGRTALIAATSSKLSDIQATITTIKLLLDWGADVNARGAEGITALIWAAKKQLDISVVQLLDRGAEVNARDSGGETALIAAFSSPSWRYEPDWRTVSTVKSLLDRGADVHARDSQGTTALIAAIPWLRWRYQSYPERIEILKLLLDQGARVDVENIVGQTAMSRAVQSGDEEAVELLCKYGAEDPRDYSVAFEALFCEA
ncbi:hypothetical protein LTR66_008066 [Elasticomyces elasticus]|nr:hypothetical protein LTR66_008066 [Elasticomyces elasticus]